MQSEEKEVNEQQIEGRWLQEEHLQFLAGNLFLIQQ